MENKTNMKFIKTSDVDMIKKLRMAGFTEIGEPVDGLHCFINDGKKLNFDVEKHKLIFTNMLCL